MTLGDCVSTAYATVLPFIGWPEVKVALYRGIPPALKAMGAGAGWGLVMVCAMGRHAWVNRAELNRRSGQERRAG